jgi:hypothetical protein
VPRGEQLVGDSGARVSSDSDDCEVHDETFP